MMDGWNACRLPASLTEPGSAATGTVMRPDTARRTPPRRDSISVLPVENPAPLLPAVRVRLSRPPGGTFPASE
ncbi:hypothetical protein LI90_2521 [Carbonactinospora thermoautotrophica]|uniref:Uncharacterized protein n=1 Tax=Carbonactinospora thermoautotrophica TaxID=1469144 RepID=A0A132MUH7_9ACTN|nr:hypothetical protein LI90_2521 [Carbonactinospora thermoautotrophica]